jgi:gliding motility-associated-like protein
LVFLYIDCMPMFFYYTLRNSVVLLLILICSQSGYAQVCNNTFQSILALNGDAIGYSVVYTAQKEIVIAGATNAESTGGFDGVLIKTDTYGNSIWARSIGGAGNDALFKVKQTADDGFIAIGSSEAPGGTGILQQIWVVKTDVSGQITWNKIIRIDNIPVKGKDIIELSTGGYALVANSNDGSSLADGIIARLDANGTLLWVQKYDSGDQDGFNSLLEVNGELLVTGFVTEDLKDAFLMKVGMNDGMASGTLLYSRFPSWEEEGICLNAIPGGYSWGMKITERETGYNDYQSYLAVFKADVNGNSYLVQKALMSPSGGKRIRNLEVKPCVNNGFVFVFDQPINHGWPQIGKLEKEGGQEWTRDYKNVNGGRDFNGLDLTGTNGYVVTGRASFLSRDAIFLLKTDVFGIAGTCATNSYGGNEGGEDQIEGKPYTWKSVQPVTTTIEELPITVKDQMVTNSVGCSNQYCDPAPPVDNGDNCATSFMTSLKEGYSTALKDAVRTSDGDIVTIGERKYYWTNRAQIVKLKPGGNIRWAKQFNVKATEDGYTYFSRVLNTSDNNLLVVGYSSVTINHSVSDSGLVMKMDYNGNVLWTKRLAEAHQGRIAFVAETEDHGFILAINSSYGVPPMSNQIVKMDANGNILWQKKLSHARWSKTLRALLYDSGSIYLALDLYSRNPNEIEVVKLNAINGDFGWSKHFRINTETVSILGLEKIRDTVFVGLGFLKELSFQNYQFHAGVMKLKDDTGEQMPGIRLNAPGLSTSKEYVWLGHITATTFTKTEDDQLVIAHESELNKDTTIRVHKLGLNGNLSWSRNFTQLKKHAVYSVKADGSGFLITGTKNGLTLLGEAANEGFVMRLNSNGEIEDGTGDCSSQVVNVTGGDAYTTPLTMIETPSDIAGVEDVRMGMNVKKLIPLESPVEAYPSCASYSTCESVTASGPDKVCDQDKNYTYHVLKEGTCTTPLIWKVDPAYADIISQHEDEVTVKFRKTGRTAVKAMVDMGCSVITVAVDVDIAQPAGKLDIGNDIELCKGASVKLDAGDSFAEYKWNDGSTLQSLLINTPGSYTVMVTDICSNQASAQITVSDGGEYPFSLGPDIVKCSETSVTLDLPAGFQNFTWNTTYNRTDLPGKVSLFPLLDTTYILEGDRGIGCKFKDTLKIKIQQPIAIGLKEDQSICPGDAVELQISNNFTNIVWTTGQTGNPIFVREVGIYIVNANDINGCISKDTFQLLSILPAPVISLPKETFICENTQQILDAGGDGISYLWNTGDITRKLSVASTGKWWVTVMGSNGCSSTDTTWYKQLAPLPRDFLATDTLMCLRGEINIPVHSRFVSYHWSNGSASQQLHTETPGLYWLDVMDNNGCVGRDSIQIGTKDCGWGVYVPNAFSPNNEYLFRVFDRWGNMVYETNQVQQGWNGLYKNEPAVTGTYVWTCYYQLKGEPEQLLKGTAILIR